MLSVSPRFLTASDFVVAKGLQSQLVANNFLNPLVRAWSQESNKIYEIYSSNGATRIALFLAQTSFLLRLHSHRRVFDCRFAFDDSKRQSRHCQRWARHSNSRFASGFRPPLDR
jgi:hypothetical protein